MVADALWGGDPSPNLPPPPTPTPSVLLKITYLVKIDRTEKGDTFYF
jgi:hypothetical protein